MMQAYCSWCLSVCSLPYVYGEQTLLDYLGGKDGDRRAGGYSIIRLGDVEPRDFAMSVAWQKFYLFIIYIASSTDVIFGTGCVYASRYHFYFVDETEVFCFHFTFALCITINWLVKLNLML